jgi:hypothetical protein
LLRAFAAQQQAQAWPELAVLGWGAGPIGCRPPG